MHKINQSAPAVMSEKNTVSGSNPTRNRRNVKRVDYTKEGTLGPVANRPEIPMQSHDQSAPSEFAVPDSTVLQSPDILRNDGASS